MATMNICIPSIEAVREFVSATSALPFDMDLTSGSRIVDAKSLMGVIYMGIGKVLRLQTPAENAPAARAALQAYLV